MKIIVQMHCLMLNLILTRYIIISKILNETFNQLDYLPNNLIQNNCITPDTVLS